MGQHRKRAPAPGAGPQQPVLAQGIALHQQGKLDEAAALYGALLRRDPRHADAWHLSGLVARAKGDAPRAVELLQKAVGLRPDLGQFHYSLGNALRDAGLTEQALAAYARSVKLAPGFASGHNGIGCIHLDRGDLPQARVCFERALALDAKLVDGWNNLANTLKAMGELDEASRMYRHALSLAPDSAAAWNNLGTALQERQQWAQARQCYERALAIDPRIPDTHANLGNVLMEQGEYAAAEPHLRRALELKPDFALALANLSFVLVGLDRLEEGEDAGQRALALQPDSAAVCRILSSRLHKQRRLVEARDLAERAVACSTFRERGLSLGLAAPVYAYLSDFSRVVTASDEALSATKGQNELVWETRLYAFSYHPDLTADQIFAEFVRWGDRQALNVPADYRNSKDPKRRLRVGFVSPDFRRHTSRFYFAPLFEHYPRDQIEFIAYANVQHGDDWTERFRGWVDGWRDIRGLADEAVARMITDDGIDILIDGCNHMQDHRLGIFTRKPAPVQVTWLGAAWTTGLPTVDYVLFDRHLAPEGTLAREQIVRLPGCFIAYRPPEDTGDVAPLPALRNGHVTFGYSGRTERLNHRTFRAWGAILQRLPSARLILDFKAFSDPPTQAYYRGFMAFHGVDVTRVEMRCSSNIFQGLGDIDLLLDCFPHSGGTMLFDALWMGVPALTLAGRPPVGRIGTSVMMSLDLPEWVAGTEEEYVDRAVALVQDIPRLAALRGGLRERMRQSPLMDERGFAGHYASALRAMWQRWCDGLPPAAFDVPAQGGVPAETRAARIAAMLQRGIAEHRAGALGRAEAAYREVLEGEPDNADAMHLLGVIEHQREHHEEAQRLIAKAIELRPDVAEYHSNLGAVLKARGEREHALAAFQRAVGLKPAFASALSNLGNVQRELGRLREAVASCRSAVALAPRLAAAHLNLGNALSDLGDHGGAVASFETALGLEPDNARVLLSLGIVLTDNGQLEKARAVLARALQVEPRNADALNNLGVVLKDQCEFEAALQAYAAAQAQAPGNDEYGSNRLFCLNYHPGRTAESIFAEYQAWDSVFARPLLQQPSHGNERAIDRRLRIGYVSPDFRRHAARHFIEPLLAAHDPAVVEVFAYAEVPNPDAVTERLRGYVDCWRSTVGLSDEQVADQIRADRIDILVDLAGHTRGNRLLAFARKPAPVQVSWLGYGYTSGLEAIDYFLGDSTLLPPDAERLFAERLVRLPVCLAYRPDAGVPEGRTEARSEPVTFGSLSRSVRINQRVVGAWAEILRRVPHSRLVINSGSFVCGQLRQRYIDRFGGLGIAAERLELGYESPPWRVLNSIDIGLDCFPHNSGTTLFETLYMGVPFVTLADRPSVGRMGAAILRGLGRPEWIAATESEYVDKAVALASDRDGLARIRTGLRAEMKGSLLMNEGAFARSVEAAYRSMWARWCEGKPAVSLEIGSTIPERPSRPPQPRRERDDAGRPPQAPPASRVTTGDDRDAERQHALGVAAYRAGRYAAAVELIGKALALGADTADCHCNYGESLRKLGRFQEARSHLEKALTLQPHHANAVINMGALLADLGDFPAAESWMRQAAVLCPANAGVHYNLGVTLKKLDRFAEARQSFRCAIDQQPEHVDAWFQLGTLAEAEGQPQDAVECYERVLACQPEHVEALNNLGVVRNSLGQSREAEALLRKAASLRPGMPEIHCNLAMALVQNGERQLALQQLQQAIQLNPGMAGGYSNLATLLTDMGQVAQAEQMHLKALSIEPFRSASNRAYSIFLWRQWRFVEAKHYAELAARHGGPVGRALGTAQMAANEAYLSDFSRVKALSDEALAYCPDDPVVWSQRLYTLSYHPDLPAAEIYAEFVRWGDRQKIEVPSSYANSADPGRKLRVGFVSPDFRRHTSRFYFAPLFEHYDRDQIEFVAYSNVVRPDDWTEKFRGWVDGWRDIRGRADRAVAEQIRADGIDILIDGCNHMQDNRLGVFAFKPAPVQATWLGAAWTTGLATVDHVLFDPYLAPDGTLARENIMRLPACFIAYRPPEDVGDVAPLPALATGSVTFGYSGRSERLNHRTFRAWGEILRRLPNARLILDYGPFADPQTQAHYRAVLAQHGVDVTRVEMRRSANIFAGLADVDILLDCFPHSGGTMLFDALWMGVPALTLAGRPPVGRIGTSLMMNLGMPDWVTSSEAEYVDRAVHLAGDVTALAQIRAGLRDRMRRSPLMDEIGFARHYVRALRQMWTTWCEEKNR